MSTAKKRGKGAEHVVMGGAGVRCLHCGEEQAIPYPCPINIVAAVGTAFGKSHKHCTPSEAGTARYTYSSPDQWLASWDTGISSLTIYAVFTGRPVLRSGPGVPHDPDDFGRCYRLLKVAPPEWRANLQRVADRYPEWAPLVARWSEIEALYEEEAPSGVAPRCYALMRSILDGAP